jgi:hypothetical protein
MMVLMGRLCIEIQEVENGYVIQEVDHTRNPSLVNTSKVWVAGDAKGLGELVVHLATEAKLSRDKAKTP